MQCSISSSRRRCWAEHKDLGVHWLHTCFSPFLGRQVPALKALLCMQKVHACKHAQQRYLCMQRTQTLAYAGKYV